MTNEAPHSVPKTKRGVIFARPLIRSGTKVARTIFV